MVGMGQIYVKPASFQISFAEGLTDQKIKKKKKKRIRKELDVLIPLLLMTFLIN